MKSHALNVLQCNIIGTSNKIEITSNFFFQPPNPLFIVCGLLLNYVQLCATSQIVAHQFHLSMGFSRQEYWNGLLCPPSGDIPDPGIEPMSLMSPHWQADSLPLAPPGIPIAYSINSGHIPEGKFKC